MKILFFTNYSMLGPSSRYRIYNYFKSYRENGVKCNYTFFWGNFYISRIMAQKNKFAKFFLLCFYYPVCIIKRFLSIPRVPFYDIVHIERDFCPGLPAWGEYLIAKVLKKGLIFEFDDAVYLSSRPRGKTEKVLGYSMGVISGNASLGDFASRYCSEVIVVPTSIDADHYFSVKQKAVKMTDAVTIGWIGTFSTIKYLELVKDVLEKLSKNYNIELNVVCNTGLFWDNGLKINNIKWSLETYVDELCKFDIGIMPLTDSEWEKGKCGFKLIQYMGVGIPVVASSVGVNNELVRSGENGYLAKNREEWYDVLEKLIKDRDLRENMGKLGRRIVEDHYSVNSNANQIIDFFKDIASN